MKATDANKDKGTTASDLMDALKGKTAEEQLAILAASQDAQRVAQEEEVSRLSRAQEEMARKLDLLAGDKAKAKVDVAAQVDKKGMAASALDVIKARPVVVTTAVVATAAVAGAGVYLYKKHHDGKAATETAGEEAMLDAPLSSSEVSKDAAVAAALGDR